MTDQRIAYLQVLTDLQNHPRFSHQDILTITGFMSEEEVSRHIARCIALTQHTQEEVAQ